MSVRWFEGFYMEMRFKTNEAIVIRLSDGLMVRTRSIQRQEREVTMEMVNKWVGAPGMVRARADGGQHDGLSTSFRVRFQAKMDCQ